MSRLTSVRIPPRSGVGANGRIWNPGRSRNLCPGVTIFGTVDSELYRSERSGLSEYEVRVPNGRYDVALMMAENLLSGPGLRPMKIVVEGQEVETGLDLYSQVGFRTAYVRLATVDVVDGNLDVHFQGLVSDPVLNGMMITPLSTGVRGNSSSAVPSQALRILSSYPNPFNGETRIALLLPKAGEVKVKVFDLLGRSVYEEEYGELRQGVSGLRWDARDGHGVPLPSGVYFFVVEGRIGRAMQRLVYLK